LTYDGPAGRLSFGDTGTTVAPYSAKRVEVALCLTDGYLKGGHFKMAASPCLPAR
jgi:hypothetical protein